MRRLLLMLILFTSSNLISGQIEGVFSCRDSYNSDVECNIYFSRNGQYFIELLESVSSDISNSTVLSFGSYNEVGDMVLLIDKVFKYRIKVKFIKDALIVYDAFSFINGKKFYLERNSCDFPDAGILKTNSLQNKILACKEVYILKQGRYCNMQGDHLYIYKNNTFRFMINDVLILEGKWCRKKNVLELIDLTLSSTFYVFIGKGKLVSESLPGRLKSCQFKICPRM